MSDIPMPPLKWFIILALILMAFSGIESCTNFLTGKKDPAPPPPLTPEQVAEKNRLQTASTAMAEVVPGCDVEKVRFYVEEQGWDPDFKIQGGWPAVYLTMSEFPKRLRYSKKASHNYSATGFGHFIERDSRKKAQSCIDLFNYLLAQGATLEHTPGTMKLAFSTGYLPLIKSLSDIGFDFHQNYMDQGDIFARSQGNLSKGPTPLLTLAAHYPYCDKGWCKTNEEAIFNWLWQQPGLRANATDQEGRTALHKIVRTNHDEQLILKRLKNWVKAGTDVCIRDNETRTAADYAAENSLIDVARFLTCST